MSIGLDGIRYCRFVTSTDEFYSGKKRLVPVLSPQRRPRRLAKNKNWSDISLRPGECNCYLSNAHGQERGSQAGLSFTRIIGITCMGVKLISDSGAKNLFTLGWLLIELPAGVRPAGGYLLPPCLVAHEVFVSPRRKEDNQAP